MQVRVDIKKGLDVPLAGAPEQTIDDGAAPESVALLGQDYPGLRPSMAVAVGDRIALGQTLFVDKREPDVRFTAPGAGEIVAINRGARRALQSVVIRLDGDAAATFASFAPSELKNLDADIVRSTLLKAGLWTAIRTRPFSRIPAPSTRPAAIFVTAIDTNPLAAAPHVVIRQAADAFVAGLEVLARLTSGKVYVCTATGTEIPVPGSEPFCHAEFRGPHPAGLVGTHIHFLAPVGSRLTVWHVGYQDVMAMGELFTAGRVPVTRIIALSGPLVRKPRLLRTRLGASVTDLLRGETLSVQQRTVSGSVLSGRRASGPLAWLGRYHQQITVLGEGSEREFLSWARPGVHKYSAERAYAGHLSHRGRFGMTTSQNGSPRAMVPIGSFEKVMPLDILATPLLKALLVKDTDRARDLGCLELDEEDLALCSFVCNGKYEYGPFLRMTLDEIEANG